MAEMIRNPEMRRIIFNPEMMRMHLQMQQAMGRGGNGPRMAAPGTTDTTPQTNTTTQGTGTTSTSTPPNPLGSDQQNPLAALLGGLPGPGGDQQQGDPIANMTRQMMQDPAAFQDAVNMLNQMGGGAGASPFGALAATPDAGAGNTGAGSPPPQNPFAALFGPGAFGAGGFGSPPPPQDNRPPEEVYEVQLRQLNEMGFYEFDRNVAALRRSGGNVQGAIEHLLSGGS